MSVEFKRTLIVMTGIHLSVVLIIFFIGVFQALIDHSADKETPTFVSIADPLPFRETIVEPEIMRPPAAVEPPLPEPEPPPVVKPPQKPKKKIEISKKKVTRPKASPPATPASKPPSANQIKNELKDLKDSLSSKQDNDLPSSYYLHVRQVVFAKWSDEKPSRDTVIHGATATVSITVERSGRITRRSLHRKSGSPVLDASALRAVNKVRELDPLPQSFKGKTKVITIDFELTG